ncbi:MAG TPA: DUF6387 family protein [Pseudomonas sp.]|jgi:hypothetical protein|uniref:DUF6387 family protein n=1 Tax=Pseudomonas sp. TaxID=306 RepID=UPI002ED86EE5
MIKLKQARKLPSWFAPTKYQGADDFKAAKWLEQLRFRRRLLIGNPLYPAPAVCGEAELALAEWRVRAEKIANELFLDPYQQLVKTEVFTIHGKSSSELVVRGSFQSPGPGQPLLRTVVFKDILDLARRDDFSLDEDQPNRRRWDLLRRSGGAFTLPGAIASSTIELEPLNCPVISVDLSASDSELRDYFEQWLGIARAERGLAAVRKNAPNYQAWAGYGVLPYLDLKIWGLLNGFEVTAQAFANALADITGDHFRGVDSVRDNTIPWARSLMEDLSALEALAKVERDVT